MLTQIEIHDEEKMTRAKHFKRFPNNSVENCDNFSNEMSNFLLRCYVTNEICNSGLALIIMDKVLSLKV